MDGQLTTRTYNGTPCYRCGNTLRYETDRGCIACAKARSEKNRIAGQNKERQRAHYHRNKARIAARTEAWRKRNKAKVAAKQARRRAQQALRTPKWLTDEHKRQMRAFYEEAARRTRETGIQWHVDHIVPLLGRNVCGLHVPANLQVITRDDNLRKGNKLLGNPVEG